MVKIHLNQAQRHAFAALMGKLKERPSPDAYDRLQRLMARVDAGKKPLISELRNVRPGFSPKTECQLEDDFHALIHVPPGWAVVSCHDSGGNHTLENAAVHLWRRVWNHLANSSAFEDPAEGYCLRAEFDANHIPLPKIQS